MLHGPFCGHIPVGSHHQGHFIGADQGGLGTGADIALFAIRGEDAEFPVQLAGSVHHLLQPGAQLSQVVRVNAVVPDFQSAIALLPGLDPVHLVDALIPVQLAGDGVVLPDPHASGRQGQLQLVTAFRQGMLGVLRGLDILALNNQIANVTLFTDTGNGQAHPDQLAGFGDIALFQPKAIHAACQ